MISVTCCVHTDDFIFMTLDSQKCTRNMIELYSLTDGLMSNHEIGVPLFILEWTTSLDSSSGTLICPSLCPRHVGRNNYVPLFGVDPIEWRLTRYYVIRDVIVIFEC